MSWFPKIKDDLEFGDFCEIYESEIYCAYMETGSYYDTDREDFDELEYESYLLGQGQWARTPSKTPEMDTPVNLT